MHRELLMEAMNEETMSDKGVVQAGSKDGSDKDKLKQLGSILWILEVLI